MFKKTGLVLLLSVSVFSGCQKSASPGDHASQPAQQTAVSSEKQALLPEVQKILDMPRPDPAVLRQDVFAAQLAFNAPEGADYMDLGSKIVLKNYDSFRRAIDSKRIAKATIIDDEFKRDQLLSPEMALNGQDIKFPCRVIGAEQCATETLKLQQEIDQLVQFPRNQKLLKRYQQMQQLPYYYAADYMYSLSSPFPAYQQFVFFTELRQAEAILAIHRGEVDKGLAILTQEMQFTKKALTNEGILIGKMIAIRSLYSNLNVVSALLDWPQLQLYLSNSRVQALLAPLTEEEQKSFAKVMQGERNLILCSIQSDGPDKTTENFTNPSEKASVSLFDLNSMANLRYQLSEPVIKRASLSMAEVSDLYVNKQLLPLDEEVDRLLAQLNEKQGGTINKTMAEMMNTGSMGEYLTRFYDFQGYLALVQVKYRIRQAGLKQSEVAAYLQTPAAQAKHPYTQQPFSWHADTGWLSTPFLTDAPVGARKEKEFRVYIPELKR